jgi:hypothetical protein
MERAPETPMFNLRETIGVMIQSPEWVNGVIWLNEKKSAGIKGVEKIVWEHQIGGYKVCQKWLSYRDGKSFSAEDALHFGKVLSSVIETQRLQKLIDEAIKLEGGLEKAFQ